MNEDIRKIKNEVLSKAREIGLGDKCDIVEDPYHIKRMLVNLRRLVELSVEQNFTAFSSDVYTLLNPPVTVPTKFGELRIGKHKDVHPHLSWLDLTKLFKEYKRHDLGILLYYLTKYQGEVLFTNIEVSGHLTSCEEMLKYIIRKYGVEL